MTPHIVLQGKISVGAKGHSAGGFTVTWLTLSCSQNCCPDYTNPVRSQPFLHMSAADTSSLNISPLKNPKAESLLIRHHASHQHFLNALPPVTDISFLLFTVVLQGTHRHQKPQYKPVTPLFHESLKHPTSELRPFPGHLENQQPGGFYCRSLSKGHIKLQRSEGRCCGWEEEED